MLCLQKNQMHKCEEHGKEVELSPVTIPQSDPLRNLNFCPSNFAEIYVLLFNCVYGHGAWAFARVSNDFTKSKSKVTIQMLWASHGSIPTWKKQTKQTHKKVVIIMGVAIVYCGQEGP